MKKQIWLCCLLFLAILSGCEDNKISIIKEEVRSIIFTAGDRQYEIKPEKTEQIIDFLNNAKIIKMKQSNKSECSFWSVMIHGSTDQILWLNQDGSFIKQDNDEYVYYELNEPVLKEMFTEAMGENIFLGEICLSEAWIKNADENHRIFSIDSHLLHYVSVGTDPSYLLNDENKMKMLTDALNDAAYETVQKEDWLGGTKGMVHLYYEKSYYVFRCLKNEMTDESYVILQQQNESDNPYYLLYHLENNDLTDLWYELFGEKVFDIDSPEIDTTKTWLVKDNENEAFMKAACEAYQLNGYCDEK